MPIKPIEKIFSIQSLPQWKTRIEVRRKILKKRQNYMFKSTNKVDIYA